MAVGWNSAATVNPITVSGAFNQVATIPEAADCILSYTSHSSGKWYFECTITGTISTYAPQIGIASSNFNLYGYPGQTGGAMSDSVGCLLGNAQDIYYDNAQVQYNLPNNVPPYSPIQDGNIVQICVDADNHLFYLLSPQYITAWGATGWNGDASANPVTQTGGISYALTTGAFIIGCNGDTVGTVVMTLNTGGSAFAGGAGALAQIAGVFKSWDDFPTATETRGVFVLPGG